MVNGTKVRKNIECMLVREQKIYFKLFRYKFYFCGKILIWNLILVIVLIKNYLFYWKN